MAFAIQFVIDVLSLGGAYALMALGLVIIYGILRLVNFAYGELIMVAGYTMFLASGSGLPWIVMAVLAVGMAILFGIITDYAAFRPVRAKSVTAVLITSFAFSNLLQNAALLFISPRPRNVPLPDIFSQTVSIGGAITPVRNLITIAASIALLAGVAFLMRRTTLGIAMRAAATNFTMARIWECRRTSSSRPPSPFPASSPASSAFSGSAASAPSFRASAWSRCSSPSSPRSSAACGACPAPLSGASCSPSSTPRSTTPCRRTC